MDRTERFYKICQRLKAGRSVPLKAFMSDLEISRPTFYRDIEYLKDRFNAPIEYDKHAHGYRFDPKAEQFELPGIWFTASEAHAMLSLHHLLNEVQPGLLKPLLEPVYQRLEKSFDKNNTAIKEMNRRIRILSMAHRKVEPNYYELISHAVLTRKRLFIHYYNRARDDKTEREISPQCLTYYRDNWYLDSHDHMRNQLRTFSLDCIQYVQLVDAPARNIKDPILDEELGSSYGIFSGKSTQTAVLQFNAFRARWVAREQWHPQQQGEWQADGTYQLHIPYADDRELLMDILKYGADVEVLSPKALRDRVYKSLQQAVKKYKNN